MPIAEKFVLNAILLEVTFGKGMVFLDKCGSVMVQLEETLGPAFEGNVPNMLQGELVNGVERVVVRYGPKAFSVTQNWIESPVRVEQVAPIAWEHVSTLMGVARAVTRFGVRFQLVWKVADLDEAERRLAGAGLFAETAEWTAIFGAPKVRTWAATTETREGTVRAALSANAVEIRGTLPPDVESLVPKYSILLDLDYAYPGVAPYALHKGQMKDFIRSSWERAKPAATSVRARLGAVQ